MEGFCKHGNESFSSIKGGRFPTRTLPLLVYAFEYFGNKIYINNDNKTNNFDETKRVIRHFENMSKNILHKITAKFILFGSEVWIRQKVSKQNKNKTLEVQQIKFSMTSREISRNARVRNGIIRKLMEISILEYTESVI